MGLQSVRVVGKKALFGHLMSKSKAIGKMGNSFAR